MYGEHKVFQKWTYVIDLAGLEFMLMIWGGCQTVTGCVYKWPIMEHTAYRYVHGSCEYSMSDRGQRAATDRKPQTGPISVMTE